MADPWYGHVGRRNKSTKGESVEGRFLSVWQIISTLKGPKGKKAKLQRKKGLCPRLWTKASIKSRVTAVGRVLRKELKSSGREYMRRAKKKKKDGEGLRDCSHT